MKVFLECPDTRDTMDKMHQMFIMLDYRDASIVQLDHKDHLVMLADRVFVECAVREACLVRQVVTVSQASQEKWATRDKQEPMAREDLLEKRAKTPNKHSAIKAFVDFLVRLDQKVPKVSTATLDPLVRLDLLVYLEPRVPPDQLDKTAKRAALATLENLEMTQLIVIARLVVMLAVVALHLGFMVDPIVPPHTLKPRSHVWLKQLTSSLGKN